MTTRILEFNEFSTGKSQRSSIFANLNNPLDPFYGFKSAHDANNVIMGENGLEKFPGNTEYLNSAVTDTPIITGLYEYKKTGSSAATYFIVCAGTKIYTASGGNLTEIYSGITEGATFNFVTFNNVCIMLNGTDDPLYFDGTTCDEISFTDPSTILGTAKPKYAEVFRNRIFYSGDAASPSKIWTPRPGTYDNFDNTTGLVDAFNISIGDGSRITRLKTFSKDLMIVYKQGSILRISGANPFGASVDPFRIEEVSKDIGCIAGRTVVQAGKDHYFLSYSGYKRLSAVDTYGDISDADPSYQITDDVNLINYSDSVVSEAHATYIPQERQIYLHVPTGSGTTNTQTFVFDVKTGSAQPRGGITAQYGAIVNRTYYTGDYSGMIHEQLDGDDYAGEAIESFWESKWLAIGGIKNKKKFKHLMIYFETSGSATITVQWTIMKMDGSEESFTKSSEAVTSDLWDVAEWDEAVFDAGQSTIFKKNNLGRGLAIKLRITNNNANERWKVRKIELGYMNLGRVAA